MLWRKSGNKMFEAKPMVKDCKELPQQSVGAPSPIVLATDDQLLLSYLLESEDAFALISFKHPHFHSFGGPNDETLNGHPLYAHGLRHYGVFEVKNSPLLKQLSKMSSVHRNFNPAVFQELNHFIFTFHDNLFECVAKSFETEILDHDGQTRLTMMQQRCRP